MRRDSEGPVRYRLPVSVLVYCFRRKAGEIEYLMLRRTAKYGGFWQGVTGALNDGETLEAGAARELWEETGYAPGTILSADYRYQFPLEDAWRWAYHPDVAEITSTSSLRRYQLASIPCCRSSTMRLSGQLTIERFDY